MRQLRNTKILSEVISKNYCKVLRKTTEICSAKTIKVVWKLAEMQSKYTERFSAKLKIAPLQK